VHLKELRIENLRVIEQLHLQLPSRWSVFVGPNGAGKTSILEAAFMLSHGRTFRSGVRDNVSRMGGPGFTVFGRVQTSLGAESRLGVSRIGGKLEARIDGQAVGLGDLVRSSAISCFEPGSHELISGASEGRRRFIDWGVFHVEHDFLREWRRYQRALRQRNALLRETGDPELLVPWEREMVSSGERLTAQRLAYIEQLRPIVQRMLRDFLGELGQADLVFQRGWKNDFELESALVEGRHRDRERGHTGRGPHRADWSISFELAPRREHLSRGQEKLCALAFILAQAELFALKLGEWPILCFDDLASELDREHQNQVLSVAERSAAQVLISGTELPPALASRPDVAVFHVEQGRVKA
jgi:DNA replication and repair protein RecF